MAGRGESSTADGCRQGGQGAAARPRTQLAALAAERNDLTAEEAALQARLRTLTPQMQGQQAHIAEADRLHAERQRHLAALAVYLDQRETTCPLCGHDWREHAALAQAVAAVLKGLPAALTALRQSVVQQEAECAHLQQLAAEVTGRLHDYEEMVQTLQQRREELGA